MKIELKEITIRELVGHDATLPEGERAAGYKDLGDHGITGYSGRLNIRPPYQREFIYKPEQRDKVIETVRKGFPLNVMYWVKHNPTDASDIREHEVLDGQQRTISICQFVAGDYSIKDKYFDNLTLDEQAQILDYKLMVYFCEGSDSEKLDWFRTINIAGAVLTPQELRNAIYTGPWLTAAKKNFSRIGGPAQTLGGDYLDKSAVRQEHLETALNWIGGGSKGIAGYMAKHQHDADDNDLWQYFNRVINWVKLSFPKYRKEMKKVAWGHLYNEHGSKVLNPTLLEAEVSRLMQDKDVTKPEGIYAYLLDGKESHLQVRAFDPAERREAYERQKGVCPSCAGEFKLEEMEADHITPWSKGGKTIASNCQMLCLDCNRRKSAI